MTFPRAKDLIAMVLAVLGLIGFASLYIIVIWRVWNNAQASPPQSYDPTEPIENVAIALAGLVGGFVAATFGQPFEQSKPAASASLPQWLKYCWRGFTGRSAWLFSWGRRGQERGQPALASDMTPQEWLGVVYIIVYFMVGAVALITWVFVSDVAGGNQVNVPDMVKNLGLLALGLVTAIAGTLVKGQKKTQVPA